MKSHLVPLNQASAEDPLDVPLTVEASGVIVLGGVLLIDALTPSGDTITRVVNSTFTARSCASSFPRG